MGDTDIAKLYIATLRFKSQIKRLYLSGPSGPEGQASFKKALAGIPAVGEMSGGPEEFVQNAVKHFAARGFERVQK